MPWFNVWIDIILVLLLVTALLLVLVALIRAIKWPSVDDLTKLAPLFNTKGGLIILLTFMWFFSLSTTVAVVVWVVWGKVDPQNSAVVTLTGMLTSGAFGGVSSVLWRTMTGEDPPAPVGTTSTTTNSTTQP
jgi:hypothetical protein